MQRPDPPRANRSSVLDRLLNDAERDPLERDLKWLLNTRRIMEPAPGTHPQVRGSVYEFGLPDPASLPAGSDEARRELQRQVEDVIRRFEPRLHPVRVTAVEDAAGEGGRMRFVVEGTLRMGSGPERVAFDTVLEVASGTFQVDGGARA
jgi:type VI secretion system lysozyme-like protein